MTETKEAMGVVFAAIDCTQRLKDASELGLLNHTLYPKRGKETYSLRKGNKVISSGNGPLKRGIKGKVLTREKNNGWNRYQVEWQGGRVTFEREQDIEKV